jgi:hypothetical protein
MSCAWGVVALGVDRCMWWQPSTPREQRWVLATTVDALAPDARPLTEVVWASAVVMLTQRATTSARDQRVMCLYLIAVHGVTEEQSACHAQAAVRPIAGTVHRRRAFSSG